MGRLMAVAMTNHESESTESTLSIAVAHFILTNLNPRTSADDPREATATADTNT